MTDDHTLDTTGLLCPLPVLKAAKRLRAMPSGATLIVTADDPAAVIDMPHFCIEQGHVLVSQKDENGLQTYVIRKG